MQSAPFPASESARLMALQDLAVLDSGPEAEFDALVKVASMVCGVPISLISLIDTERQWFKANIGLPGVSETPRDIAFCAHAILDSGLFEVPDASQDARFFDNPLVASQPDIRFYAGAPITLSNGHRVGTLCVIDRQPHQLDPNQREILHSLAVAAAQALEGRQAMRLQQQTALALRKSQTLLDRTGRLAGIGGWEVDLVSGTIFWSDETCRIHGVPPGYAPTLERAIDFYAPEARPQVQAVVAQAMAGGSGWDREWPFIRQDGERIWVRAVGAVEFENGTPVRLVGAFQDVTARRQEQATLEEAQERSLLATESGGIGIWDLDLVSMSLLWDAQSYRLYGLEPSNALAAYDLWARHLHPDDRAATEIAFQRAIETGQDFFNEFRVVWTDGSVHHLRGYGRLRCDAQGKPLRMVGTNMDVTEAAHYSQSLKEARDKAEEASQSKGQFLANMSHEIRTPMNAILGMLNLLQGTELTARQRDYASKTEGAAKSLLGLLNDILDFSKADAGKMTLEREPFRMDHMLRSLSVVLSANVGAKSIEVLFDVDATLPEVVLGDAMRLQQVLINLGGNAVKFTSSGQVVLALRNLGVRGDGVAIEFAVQDTGIGIAPQDQARIFSGFSQAEASTTRRFGGSGLGLAISKRLVELMGGEIRITSTLGGGSTFAFTVELAVPVEVPPELLSPVLPRQAPRRVLVVDDNPIAGALMQRMVRSWGWPADLASSGAQALAMVQAEQSGCDGAFPYPVVYMDWQMPGMDGWETTRRLRQISQQCTGPEPTVIMVTAHGRQTLAQRSTEEQALLNGFLVKPTTASMLLDAVTDAATVGAGLRKGARAGSSERQLSGMRILVVEDNLINQQVAEELLSAQGALVSMAANGQLGVEAVAAAAPQFDVVLMDIQMPVLDGYGATRLIREQLGLSALPIVAMTANAMASDREACLAGGMNEHVGKPFDMAQLVALLVRVTGFQVAPAPPVDRAAAVVPARGTSNPVPGLDMVTALARMSGLKSLYVRTASDFSRILGTVIADLQQLLDAGALPKAVMLLHTLKGNAGTLGAEALAAEAGRLETLCKTPAVVAGGRVALDALAGLTESTRTALALAMAWLAPAPLAHEAPAPNVALDVSKALTALRELDALLLASDLAALQRHAELRPCLAGLPAPFGDDLDAALQSLELDAAHRLCQQMQRQLQA
jgi:two-component system sensor histidine kinase/response regulator